MYCLERGSDTYDVVKLCSDISMSCLQSGSSDTQWSSAYAVGDTLMASAMCIVWKDVVCIVCILGIYYVYCIANTLRVCCVYCASCTMCIG